MFCSRDAKVSHLHSCLHQFKIDLRWKFHGSGSKGICDRRFVTDLSIFYKHFHGHCSLEIGELIPVPPRRVRTTRSSTHSHPFQVSLPTSRTLSHKSSFIPRTCNLWNVLPSSSFLNPTTCRLSNLRSINLI